MSIRAIAWAFEQKLNPCRKLVLLALADNASDTGMAYPSTETISRKTGLCQRSVVQALDSLVEQGWIEDSGKRTGRTKQIKVYCLKAANETIKAVWDAGLKPANGSVKAALDADLRLHQVHPEPSEEPLKEPKSTKLSEVIEILKEDPRYDGLDIDLELEKAMAWRRKKNMGVSERFLRYWLDNADRDLEGDDDEELYISQAYYSWEGWTDERVRAMRELWPGAAEPPQRWDTLSRNLQELIETRVKEGWS